MSKRTTLICFSLTLCGLMAFTGAATAASSHPGKHCIIQTQPVPPEPGKQAIRPKVSACYNTFPDAIFAATGGRIHLSEAASFADQLKDLDRQQKALKLDLSEASDFVVAIDYKDSGFVYVSGTLSWTSPVPCSATSSRYAPSMPAGWDNVVSSTQGLSFCDQNILWENTFYSGVTQTCAPDCTNLGAMNDRTSSREWHASCNGTSGQWAGCRGTGCHVCSELVANYHCYFVNHPKCVSNGTCDGQYYTCNQDCPAPTANDIC
jgi:hypothetical protein